MSSIEQVTIDLYRDIHKGIRTELFTLTQQAGSVDPGSRCGRADLAAYLDRTIELLVAHAEHEDTHVQPAIERELPDLAEQIEGDHVRLEARLVDLQSMAYEAVDAMPSAQRFVMHRLYLELGAFTSSYLAHQDLEERLVMPSLERAIGVEATLAIHGAIIASIPPDQMASSLALMLPSMNLDDRAEMLGAIRAGAPAPVFEGLWGLAGSVLAPSDLGALGTRLDIAA